MNRGERATSGADTYTVAVLPGDGIGPEVMKEALRVLDAAGRRFGFSCKKTEELIGGAAIDASGVPLPENTVRSCLDSDAVLLGSVGGPKWDTLEPALRPERGGLLALRKEMKLYANLRPVKLIPETAGLSPLKKERLGEGVDLLTVRELSGGIYFGEPKAYEKEYALDTMIYRRETVRKIARTAFESAAGRRGKLCSVDKANVLSVSMLWREIVEEMSSSFPEVQVEHMYVDNAAMQLILNPSRFDVICTGNLFGDILSDESAALAGSLGLLPSASLGEKVHLYEPAGGSAPDIAGKGIANPMAQILSTAMMCRYSFGRTDAADAIEAALMSLLRDGIKSADLCESGEKAVSTEEIGEEAARRIAESG
ncbi:MAG: 3-isopropylmalate dehydrogenase [Spirochaetaceae bacterium]